MGMHQKYIASTTLGLSGYYRLWAHAANGKKRPLTDWFSNLILNNGLDLIADNSLSQAMANVYLGSGNTPPSAGDDQLDSLIASTNGGSTLGINESGRYFFLRRRYSFAQGAAAGNISELAVGKSFNDLFSRSLIKNSDGNPVTLTVQNNEFLTVEYELRVNQPVDDVVGNVDGRDIILRACSVNATYWSDRAMAVIASRSGANQVWASLSDISTIDSFPPFVTNSQALTVDNHAYVFGSHTRTATVTFGIDRANFDIKSFAFNFGPGFWQFSVDPVIPKTNEDELKLDLRITWARVGELPA